MIDFVNRKTITNILEVVEEASESVLDIYNLSDFELELKSDASPITKADTKANNILCNGLSRIAPNVPIISEENKQIGFDIRKDFSFCWLIDPLDGTKEFIKKNGEFTIHVALLKGNEVIVSIVAVPAQRNLYWAVKGQGAFHQRGNTEVLMECRPFSFNQQDIKVLCSRSHLDNGTTRLINCLDNPIKVSVGSSLKFIQIALGEADFYPRLAPTMEWDTAAPQLILEEAGGKVLQLDGQAPLAYNKEKLINPPFVALGKINEPFPVALFDSINI